MQGAGMFSKLSGYVKGAMHGAGRMARSAPGYMPQARNVGSGFAAGIAGRAGGMPSQMFRGGYRAGLAMRSPGGGAVAGAAAGGAYGAVSDDTSVLGGALMGAGLGAGAAFGGTRFQSAYGQAARAGGKGATVGSNVAGALGVMANQARTGFSGARLSANRGWNSFKARAGGR